ncbi:MAG: MgtC/SapB family protein [Acidimicrobiales bacterium]
MTIPIPASAGLIGTVFAQAVGEGWRQIAELALAFVLSALIGLERELRQKSAGLRTHTIVGFAAALIMLISKYGFGDVISFERIVLDPSRIAAQIVSGIGFIGGGLIFVRRDAVRGLTTAAVVWLTAAVGMAAGAGLPILAVVVTAGHFLVVFGGPPIARRLPRSRYLPSQVHMTYEDGRGVLRRALVECTRSGFTVNEVTIERDPMGAAASSRRAGRDDRRDDEEGGGAGGRGRVSVVLSVAGTGVIAELVTSLAEIDGVVTVNAGDVNETAE